MQQPDSHGDHQDRIIYGPTHKPKLIWPFTLVAAIVVLAAGLAMISRHHVASIVNPMSGAASNSSHWYKGNLPNSSAVIVKGSVYLIDATFSAGSSAGTITITDGSTHCGGLPCAAVNALTIQAGTVYRIPFNGSFMPSGIVASSAGGPIEATIFWAAAPVLGGR